MSLSVNFNRLPCCPRLAVLRESFVFALGMLVALIPEGLLPTVSLALALGVQPMAESRAVVKRLSSVETLGCTTVICTDKTGTTTENEMTVRREVPTAVERCHRVGIHVAMLTGDHAHIALAVACQGGIARPDDRLVTGSEIDEIDDEHLCRFLGGKRPRFFAHVTPEHKLRLVRAYLQLGEVVAVTGDGVNDAPALRAADIGAVLRLCLRYRRRK